MSDTIDRLVRILDEERAALKLAIQQRLESDQAHLATQRKLERAEELTASFRHEAGLLGDKVEEWIDYSNRLVAMLKHRKVLAQKIPPAPAPAELPF